MSTLHRRFYLFPGLLCVAGLTLACEGVAESLTQSSAAPSANQPSSGPVVTLEFEPPPQFFERPTDSASAITGFRVGYFRVAPDGRARMTDPLRTVDFAPDALQLTGRLARLSFTAEAMPPGDTTVVFRVQALTAREPGWWSEPSAIMTLPVREGAPASRRARSALYNEVVKHPALLEALRAVTSTAQDDASLQSESNVMYMAFRRVNALATAVVICRDHGVPCEELARAVIGPPRRPLRMALGQWKDDKAIPALIKSARTESRRLLAPSAK